MTEHGIRNKSKVIVLQLDYKIKEDDLRRIFEKAGTVINCHLFLKSDKTSAGRATILFKKPEEATNAIDAFDQQVVGSRRIKVELFQANRANRRGYDDWDLTGRDPRTTQHQRSRMMKRRLDQTAHHPYRTRNISKTNKASARSERVNN